jgi:hypothetical protein
MRIPADVIEAMQPDSKSSWILATRSKRRRTKACRFILWSRIWMTDGPVDSARARSREKSASSVTMVLP